MEERDPVSPGPALSRCLSVSATHLRHIVRHWTRPAAPGSPASRMPGLIGVLAAVGAIMSAARAEAAKALDLARLPQVRHAGHQLERGRPR